MGSSHRDRRVHGILSFSLCPLRALREILYSLPLLFSRRYGTWLVQPHLLMGITLKQGLHVEKVGVEYRFPIRPCSDIPAFT